MNGRYLGIYQLGAVLAQCGSVHATLCASCCSFVINTDHGKQTHDRWHDKIDTGTDPRSRNWKDPHAIG